jgi:hypothetical protein
MQHDYTEHEIRCAIEATHGHITNAARRLGMARGNFIAHAARKGVNASAVRTQIRSRMFAAAPVMPAPVQESGDQLPSARSVVSDALVDLSCAAMEILRIQSELEDANRIIASLTASLEAVGAHLEAA